MPKTNTYKVYNRTTTPVTALGVTMLPDHYYELGYPTRKPYLVMATTADIAALPAGVEAMLVSADIPDELSDLIDVNVSGAANGDLLVYDSTSGDWDSTPASASISLSLAGLVDVNVSGASSGDILVYDSASGNWNASPVSSSISVQYQRVLSRPGTLASATGSLRWYPPSNITIVSVKAAVGTAPSGSNIVVDVNIDGTTAFTAATKPTIPDGTNISSAHVPDVTSVPATSYMTVDVDSVGSSTAGSDLTVLVSYTIP